MGRAKQDLIEKEQHERNCPECGATVWVDWKASPNVKCSECGYEGDVKQCNSCQSLIPKNSDEFLCYDCIEYSMRED